MMLPQRSTILPVSILVASISVLGILPETPPNSGAPQNPPSSIDQATETREPYPENKQGLDVDGPWYALNFHYYDASKDKEKDFSCKINIQENRTLQNQEGLDICLAKPIRSGEERACYDHDKDKDHPINWGAVPGEDRRKYMQGHGLRFNGENWTLHYEALIRQARPLLQDCRDKLKSIQGNPEDSFRGESEALMEFVLSIPYKPLEDIDCASRRWTLGFRVPTAVMLQDEGDCDSKAALYCSLLRHARRELVIFRSIRLDDPEENAKGGHAMLGVDPYGRLPKYDRRHPASKKSWSISGGDEYAIHYLNFGNHDYIPIDPTGPGKLKYGQVAKEKAGLYEAIPISISGPTTLSVSGATGVSRRP